MNILKITAAAAVLGFSASAGAQVVFYEHDNFNGRNFTAEGTVGNFQGSGFNDRASSVTVLRGRWEICSEAHFGGECVVLRPGDRKSTRLNSSHSQISY